MKNQQRKESIQACHPVTEASAKQFTWGQSCTGWWFLKSEDLSVIKEQMPPGTSEVKHYHAQTTQHFYVLSGQLTIQLSGKIVQLQKDEGFTVWPNVVHCVRNDSMDVAAFLVISSPGRSDDRVEL
ncbi:MAG: cupin domain-containing protein [Pseudomonadota bacterium]